MKAGVIRKEDPRFEDGLERLKGNDKYIGFLAQSMNEGLIEKGDKRFEDGLNDLGDLRNPTPMRA